MNRGGRPVQQNTQSQSSAPGNLSSKNVNQKDKNSLDKSKVNRIIYVAFISLVGILLIALLALMIFHKSDKNSEARHVDTSKYQAVFLNGGQVYFGKVSELNSKFLNLNDIYYLRVNQQVQPDQNNAAGNDISLVKLGCELHGPQDAMVINREQVTFWENLKDDGQVANAIAEFVKANPNGQNCETQAQQNNNNGGSNNNTPATAPENNN